MIMEDEMKILKFLFVFIFIVSIVTISILFVDDGLAQFINMMPFIPTTPPGFVNTGVPCSPGAMNDPNVGCKSGNNGNQYVVLCNPNTGTLWAEGCSDGCYQYDSNPSDTQPPTYFCNGQCGCVVNQNVCLDNYHLMSCTEECEDVHGPDGEILKQQTVELCNECYNGQCYG